MNYIYNLTIYNVNKPSEEEAEEYALETLKQRNLKYADFALASLNMSKEPGLYSKGDGSIDKITVPVLHLWGENDLTVLEYMVIDNMNAMQNSKYVKFSKCGHSPLVDCPNKLTEEIMNFI